MASETLILKEKGASLIFTSGATGRVNALFSMRALRSLLALINAVVLLLLLPFRGRRRISTIEKPRKEEQQIDCHRKGAMVRVPATIVPWKSSISVSSSSSGTMATTPVKAALTRRATAIKRVVEDNDPRTLREYWLFVTRRGETIFTQSWTPVSVKIRALVLLVHGLNEHSGRYSDFAKQLNANGYKVFGMDWIGHGGSDGLHAYVNSLDDAVSDVKVFLEKILTENPGYPCFLYGHSTGGAIILKALLDPEVEAGIAGAVMTSPAVGVQPSHPIFALLAPIVSFFMPTFQFSAANKNGLLVSRDPEALAAKYSDPLVYTGSIRVRTGYEILRMSTLLLQNLRKFRVAFFVLHGTADAVTDPQGSQKLYEEASSADKTIKLYDGLLHDLLFEPEKDDIVQDIFQWLNSRLE